VSNLPANWTNSTLGKLAGTGQYGWTTKASDQGKVKFLRTTDITKGKIDWQRVPFCSEEPSDADKYSLSVGDILISRAGSVGFSSLLTEVPEKAVFASYLIRYMPNMDIVVPRYLAHYLKSKEYWNQIAEVSAGVALTNVNATKLAALTLPLAPLNEQKRIADKLDSVLARVDACLDRLDRIPTILKRFRQSVLAAATSGKLTEEWRDGDTSSWLYERAADVCGKVQSGGTPKEGFTHEGIPFLKVYNIVDQKVAFDCKPQYITPSIHGGSMSKSQTQPGDVLMNIVGPPLGKVAIVPDSHPSWNINQAITLFRPSDRISTGWLYCILCGGKNIAEIIHKTRGSAGQTNISLSQCRDFIFPVPPVKEQTEIVRRVEALFAMADCLDTRYITARSQVEKLTPSTLAKAFRGELVLQDPNDEPASVLLDRLLMTKSAGTKAGKNQNKTNSSSGLMPHGQK
jgi:type I restriction enzyme S subunit